MKVQIQRRAYADLQSGRRYYEGEEPGLGNYFLDSLYADIESLRHYAGIHPLWHGRCHRMVASRFPFAIFYEIKNGIARVRAVIDCRRDPRWIERHVGR